MKDGGWWTESKSVSRETERIEWRTGACEREGEGGREGGRKRVRERGEEWRTGWTRRANDVRRREQLLRVSTKETGRLTEAGGWGGGDVEGRVGQKDRA